MGYFEDFETAPVGWKSSGVEDSWQWGKPTSGPRSATSGEKVYATNLTGNYDNKLNATLVMPPVFLPEGPSFLQLSSWHDFAITGGVPDYGQVVISTDQVEWTSLYEINRSSGGWGNVTVDLSEYSGQEVFIGFKAHSINSLTRAGWYIDDVALSETATDIAAPDKKKASNEFNLNKADKKVSENEEDELLLPPLDAKVSVLETGRSVNTNPEDGTYSLFHQAGTFTMRAEAYGYHASEKSITCKL